MAKEKQGKTREVRAKEPLPYFAGLVLMGIGILLVFSNVRVTTMWHSWGFGSWMLPTGVAVLPLLIGIGMFMYRPSWLASKIVMAIGVGFLLLTIILSVQFTMVRTSLLTYVAMVGCFAVGMGLFLRGTFPPRKK